MTRSRKASAVPPQPVGKEPLTGAEFFEFWYCAPNRPELVKHSDRQLGALRAVEKTEKSDVLLMLFALGLTVTRILKAARDQKMGFIADDIVAGLVENNDRDRGGRPLFGSEALDSSRRERGLAS